MPRLRPPFRWRTASGLVLAACLLPALAAAQDPSPAPRMTLPQVLANAAEGHPEIGLVIAEMAAARGRLITAGRLANPVLALGRETLSSGDEEYEETTAGISQPLDFAGQRGLRRSEARLELAAAEARVAAARVGVAFAVRRAYVLAAVAEQRLAVIDETAALFRQVERAAAARYAESDISAFELGRLRLERTRYEIAVDEARLELGRAARELGRLARAAGPVLPADSLTPALARPSLPTLETALATVSERPDVRSARASKEAAQARVALERRLRVPPITLSGGVKEQTGGFRGVTLGLSLPLPILDRNAGQIAVADAERVAAETRYAFTVRTAEDDIRSAWEAYRARAERAALLETDPAHDASALLAAARVAYDEGEMTLLELLDAAAAYRAGRETALDLTAAYWIGHYDLERSLGVMSDPLADPMKGSPE